MTCISILSAYFFSFINCHICDYRWIILDKTADPGIDVRAVLRNIRAMRAACFQAKNLHPTTTALPQRKSRQVPSNAISKRHVCSAALGVAPQEVAADDTVLKPGELPKLN